MSHEGHGFRFTDAEIRVNSLAGSLLREVRLFSGLSVESLESILGLGAVRTLGANTVFIERGEASSVLYCLLSGRVKIYRLDPGGEERVLDILGPGDHLGELALLGDSVRKASAVTLEETRVFVLSRRAFLPILSKHPQIAFNLDNSLTWSALEADLGAGAGHGYRAWAQLRQSGLPLILLIGGTTGTGKSTVAAELGLRLDIGRTLSTDILREVMRLLIPERLTPELHASTFEAWKVLPAAQEGGDMDNRSLIEGYRAQAAKVAVAIDGVIERSIKENSSTIIEGIHLSPAYHLGLPKSAAMVVPLLLTIPTREVLEQHFIRRGHQAPSRGTSRYIDNFENIWRLQDHFIAEAERLAVPVVPNLHVDHSVSRVMEIITDALIKRFAQEPLVRP